MSAYRHCLIAAASAALLLAAVPAQASGARQGVTPRPGEMVLLRDVSPGLPRAQTARTLHRLHSEVQMLLYTHAFNDRRAERGLQPINAFWLA